MMNVKKTAMKILGIDEITYDQCNKRIDEISGWYCWNPARGGLAMIINEQGDKLIATSGVSFERHLKDFIDGKRN